MKIKLLSVLLALSLTIPVAAQAATNDAEAVVKAVSTFYKGYITALDTNDKTYAWQKQPEIDPSFANKIKALIEKAEKEDGILGYDPILMGQESPQSMKYVTPVIKGDKAEIGAYKVWSEEEYSSSLCVMLKKSGGVWRIADVIDMNWYEGDAILECGGLKRAPEEKK